jgi:hypothetical protein
MIRDEVMIYPYGSHDLSGSRSLFSRIKGWIDPEEVMIYPYESNDDRDRGHD